MAINKDLNNIKKAITEEEIEANKDIFGDYDPNFLYQINNSLFNIISKSYFRPVYIGFENYPERNNPKYPVILASNHSGMAFPWDAMVFGCCLQEKLNYKKDKTLRAIVAPQLSGIPAMHPFFMKGAWKISGGVDATFLNFETMMHYPDGHLLVYPEGVPGIGKGFNNRYKLQRFATSFIRMSLKYKTDILPYSTINAEYVVPFVYSFEFINKFFRKIGVPFMAIGIPTLLLIFPWAFYIALPTKMHFVMGKRISPYKWIDKEYDELDKKEIEEIRDRVHEIMQTELNLAESAYGKSPYNFKEFFQKLWKYKAYFPYNLPIFWPILFHEFERQWVFEKKCFSQEDIDIKTSWGTMIRLIYRNPIVLAYYIPILGWLILIIYGKNKWKKLDKLGKPLDKN